MRHPIFRLAGQGFWYAAGNVMAKVSGLVLLPVFTNTAYLSAESFGLWGVFEITAALATGIVGLQLAVGLVRFYADPPFQRATPATTWWVTVLLAASGAMAACLVIYLLRPAAMGLYLLLVAFIGFELLLSVPLALLRAQEKASRYALLLAGKFGLIVALSFVLLVWQRLGLPGLIGAYASAGAVTLVVAMGMTAGSGMLRVRVDPVLARRLVAFSAPLVLAGIGSMILNASDRYVLLGFRTAEEVAIYTLAAKFGGVVNMFAVQPLQLAFLPILFRLRAEQRTDVLQVVLRHAMLVMGFLVVSVSLFTEPVLDLFGSDLVYRAAVPLVPWVALGFMTLGASILYDGVLALFHRTGLSSGLMSGAAVLNVLLNLALVPVLGALGAAITTLASYAALFVVRQRAASRLLPSGFPWSSVVGISGVTATLAFAGVLLPLQDDVAGLALRAGLLAGWLLAVVAFRWLSPKNLRTALALLANREGMA
jgi:O-antigen/teichoic acid export membrane protein